MTQETKLSNLKTMSQLFFFDAALMVFLGISTYFESGANAIFWTSVMLAVTATAVSAGLKKHHRWAWVVGLALAILHLQIIPIGTIAGSGVIYILVVCRDLFFTVKESAMAQKSEGASE